MHDKRCKISFILKDQFRQLSSLFHYKTTLEEDWNKEEGAIKCDLIRTYNLGNSRLSIKIEKDDVNDSGEIRFHILRFISGEIYHSQYEKPLRAKSRSLSYEEFKEIMNSILKNVSFKEEIFENLNKLDLFDVDLNLLLISQKEFADKLLTVKTPNDLLFDDTLNKIDKLSLNIEKELESVCEDISSEESRLNQDQKYLKLLEEQKRIEKELKKMEEVKIESINKKDQLYKQKNVLNYFIQEKERINKYHINNSIESLKIRKKLGKIIELMVESKDFNVFGDDFKELPQTLDVPFTFEMLK